MLLVVLLPQQYSTRFAKDSKEVVDEVVITGSIPAAFAKSMKSNGPLNANKAINIERMSVFF